MKILHASHISNYTPPIGYGGIELMVDTLAREQIKRGHRVFVLGVKQKGIEIPYEIESVFSKPVKELSIRHKLKYSWKLLIESKEFDVVHLHIQPLALVASLIKHLRNKAVLLTLHADPSSFIARLGIPLVAISESQRRRLEKRGAKIATTIYNGIDVSRYPFRTEKKDFFIYVGRIDETKGVHIAIQAAMRCNKKLVIIGPIANYSYFENLVKPFIDNKNVVYLGEVDFETKISYLSRAKALLYPVQYEEFFGIVMVEALAVGTPVIGFARGSVTEIVRDGVTGFLVNNIEEMCKAMKHIIELNSKECRRDAEERFSSKTMAERYEELYRQLLG